MCEQIDLDIGGTLAPRPYFYIKVIFRPRHFNIKIGPGNEANSGRESS